MTDSLSYPIGRWTAPASVAAAELAESVARIAALPDRLRAAVKDLDPPQLATPYRPGGWTVRQLVHHLADSHLNAYVRIKLGVTEDEPRITAYDQEAWATLPDVELVPIAASLGILDGIHARWAALLGALTAAQWQRRYLHPENGVQRLDIVVHHYAWHGNHHLAHISALRERMGW